MGWVSCGRESVEPKRAGEAAVPSNIVEKAGATAIPRQEAAKENAGAQEALTEELKNAIMKCNAGAVRELLKAHPELVNAKDQFGTPPLHCAADWGNAETVKALIEAGANVNATEEMGGFTVLENAAGAGVVAKAEVLIAGGADVNACDRDGETPLIAAIASGNPKMVELLLKSGARPTGKEMDALQQAMKSDQMTREAFGKESSAGRRGVSDSVRRIDLTPGDFEEISKLLLAQGADTSKPGREGASQLHEAARVGQVGVARQLIDAGSSVNAKDPRGCTPLHLAVAENQLEMVEFLLSQGTDVNAQDSLGQTPLHEVAHSQLAGMLKLRQGDPRIGELLLSKGADVNRADVQGWTPLHHARYYGNGKVADGLVSGGADAQVATKDGFTPDNVSTVREFFSAVAQGDASKVSQLLEAHPTLLNARCVAGGETLRGIEAAEAHDKSETGGFMLGAFRKDPFRGDGWTPLHEAVLDNQEEIVKLLLKKGADVNATTIEEGATPLHTACWTQNESMLNLLLDAGADANKGDYRGNSPVHEAAPYSQTAILETLLKRGANPNVKNKDGFTPLALERRAHKGVKPVLGELINPEQTEEAMKQLPPEVRAEIEKAGGFQAFIAELAAQGTSRSESLLLKYGAQDK